MVIRITNQTHPMELDVVANMLTQHKLAPERVSHTELRLEIPTESWFDSIKQAVEFMTECGVEKIESK